MVREVWEQRAEVEDAQQAIVQAMMLHRTIRLELGLLFQQAHQATTPPRHAEFQKRLHSFFYGRTAPYVSAKPGSTFEGALWLAERFTAYLCSLPTNAPTQDAPLTLNDLIRPGGQP